MFGGVEEDSNRNSIENADFDESNMDVEPELEPSSYQDHLDDLSAESDDDAEDILLLPGGSNKENFASNHCSSPNELTTNRQNISEQMESFPDEANPSCVDDDRTARSATTSVCSSTGSV